MKKNSTKYEITIFVFVEMAGRLIQTSLPHLRNSCRQITRRFQTTKTNPEEELGWVDTWRKTLTKDMGIKNPIILNWTQGGPKTGMRYGLASLIGISGYTMYTEVNRDRTWYDGHDWSSYSWTSLVSFGGGWLFGACSPVTLPTTAVIGGAWATFAGVGYSMKYVEGLLNDYKNGELKLPAILETDKLSKQEEEIEELKTIIKNLQHNNRMDYDHNYNR